MGTVGILGGKGMKDILVVCRLAVSDGKFAFPQTRESDLVSTPLYSFNEMPLLHDMSGIIQVVYGSPRTQNSY